MSLIEKGAQSTPSFEEQMRAAEEAAGVPSDEELYGSQYEQSPRDEFGRFATTRPVEETPVEAEPVEEPQAEVVETPQPITDADPGDETDLTAKFEELNKKLGQLINENAELRRAQEQVPVQEQQYVPSPQEWGWLEANLEENPAQVAEWARTNKQDLIYDRAVRAWAETDPIGASRYDNYWQQTKLVESIGQTIAPQIQSAQAVAAERDIERAISNVAARHPDFGDVVGVLDEAGVEKIMQSGLPAGVLANALQGTQQEKEQAIETVYRWQKAEIAGSFAQAAEAVDQQVKGEAREAKLEAFVGSATTTVPDAVPETEAERMVRAWNELRPSMSSAWTGRDSRQRLGR